MRISGEPGDTHLFARRRAMIGLAAVSLGGFIISGFRREASAGSVVGAPSSVIRFTKAGAGAADGSSWADAMPIERLGDVLADAEPGASFLIGFSPDDDPILVRETSVRCRVSGSADALIQMKAGIIDPAGGVRSPADGLSQTFFKSARPWSVADFAKDKRTPCYLTIEKGASHLLLAGFQVDGTTGDGFLKFRAGKGDPETFASIRIAGIGALNIGRVIETDKNAVVDNLILEDCRAFGIVRGFARFHNLSNAILRNLDLDAAGMDGGRKDICQLIAVTAGENITFENLTLKNAVNAQVKSDGSQGYVQGDGIVCERGTRNVVIRNCQGSGMGDGAFDLKTAGATIEDSSTDGCKFGARIWSEADNVIRRCSFRNPVTRGKHRGACIQVSGRVTVLDTKLQAGRDQAAISFSKLSKSGPPMLRMVGGSIELDGDAKLARPVHGATLELENVTVNGDLRSERLVFDQDENGGDSD